MPACSAARCRLENPRGTLNPFAVSPIGLKRATAFWIDDTEVGSLNGTSALARIRISTQLRFVSLVMTRYLNPWMRTKRRWAYLDVGPAIRYVCGLADGVVRVPMLPTELMNASST